jgi:hypothetical protein
MIEWNIQSRSHACQACGKGFADQQPYHTLLFDEKRDYRRLDVCEPCWGAQYSQGATERKGFISHWQGVYEAPPAAPPDPIQKETAETVLRNLIGQNEPHYAAARFILAVMLERKRLLKVKAQFTQDGQRVFVYEHARSGEVFNVPDPNLQLTQLDAVQREVAGLLERGVEPAGSTELTAAASVSASSQTPPASAAPPAEPSLPDPAPREAAPAELESATAIEAQPALTT